MAEDFGQAIDDLTYEIAVLAGKRHGNGESTLIGRLDHAWNLPKLPAAYQPNKPISAMRLRTLYRTRLRLTRNIAA